MSKGDVVIFLNSIRYIENSLSDYNDMDLRVFDELSAMRTVLNKYYNHQNMNKDNKIPWLLKHPFYKPETVLGILCGEFFFTGIIVGGIIVEKLCSN